MGQLAAIYCRVSTSDQDCDRQEQELRAHARRARYTVVGVWKETASGVKVNRVQRAEVIALARARKIDLILVTELIRWGRSTVDLLDSLSDLQSWGVSLVAEKGFQFDLGTAQGKVIASFMAALATFERDLLRERVKSGIVAAKARGVVFGRRPGPRPRSKFHTPRVLSMVDEKISYREISRRIGLSKNTILDIVKRHRSKASS